MGKKKINVYANRQDAANFATTIVSLAECSAAQRRLSMLNGIAIALSYETGAIKKMGADDGTDEIERLVLWWLKAMDEEAGINFGKYIKDFSTDGLFKVED